MTLKIEGKLLVNKVAWKQMKQNQLQVFCKFQWVLRCAYFDNKNHQILLQDT